MKIQCKPDRFLTFEAEQHFRSGMRTKEVAPQSRLGCDNLVGKAFVVGQLANEREDQRHMLVAGAFDVKWERAF